MYSAIKVQTIYNDGKIFGTFYMIVLANNQLPDNFTERDIC